MSKAIKLTPPPQPPAKTPLQAWLERVEATFRDLKDLGAFAEKMLPMAPYGDDASTLSALNATWSRLGIPSHGDAGIEHTVNDVLASMDRNTHVVRSALTNVLMRMLNTIDRLSMLGIVDETCPIIRRSDFGDRGIFNNNEDRTLAFGDVGALAPNHPAKMLLDTDDLFVLQTTRGEKLCLVLGDKSSKLWSASLAADLTQRWRSRQKVLLQRQADEERQKEERRLRDHRASLAGRLELLEKSAERIASLERELERMKAERAAEAPAPSAST